MVASLGGGNNRVFIGLGIILAGAGVLAVVLWGCGGPKVTGGSEQDRADAVVRIAAQRPLGAKDSLATAAQDQSPIVRRAAIVGLTQIMDSEDRPVIEQAVKDKDATVRSVAAESLGKFNDAPATGELIRLLETDPDESVRMAALRGLVDCDDPRAIVAMVEPAGKVGVGGARHLGKVNGLWADGSVTANMPLSISPRLCPEAWAPKVPHKKPAS